MKLYSHFLYELKNILDFVLNLFVVLAVFRGLNVAL